MEIITLGTSSGTPTKFRNVSATAVKLTGKKSWVLIDCGEGTQHQLLHTPLALNHLSAIMITHVHGDHIFGLPGLLASASMAGRQAPITIVAPEPVADWLKSCQQVSETYLSYEINFIDVESIDKPQMLNKLLIMPQALSHRVPSYAYIVTETQLEKRLDTQKLTEHNIPPGPLWGQIQNGQDVTLPNGKVIHYESYLLAPRKPRKIIIGGDNDRPELLSAVIEDTDVLIHEATYTDAISAKVGPGPQHSSAKLVASFAENNHLRNLVLTHFSARYQYGSKADANISEIEDEAKQFYSGQLYLANDFDHFSLDTDGRLNRLSNLKSQLK